MKKINHFILMALSEKFVLFAIVLGAVPSALIGQFIPEEEKFLKIAAILPFYFLCLFFYLFAFVNFRKKFSLPEVKSGKLFWEITKNALKCMVLIFIFTFIAVISSTGIVAIMKFVFTTEAKSVIFLSMIFTSIAVLLGVAIPFLIYSAIQTATYVEANSKLGWSKGLDFLRKYPGTIIVTNFSVMLINIPSGIAGIKFDFAPAFAAMKFLLMPFQIVFTFVAAIAWVASALYLVDIYLQFKKVEAQPEIAPPTELI